MKIEKILHNGYLHSHFLAGIKRLWHYLPCVTFFKHGDPIL